MNDRHDQSLYPAGTDAMDIDARQSSHPAAQARSFQRQSPHVTQTPIDDVEPQYVTRERYVTLEQAQGQGRRRHMGVATSNPSYLPKTEMQMRLDAERMAAERGRQLEAEAAAKNENTDGTNNTEQEGQTGKEEQV